MATKVTDKDIMELIKIRDSLKKYKENLEKNRSISKPDFTCNSENSTNTKSEEKNSVLFEKNDLKKEDLMDLLEKLKEIKKEIEKNKEKNNKNTTKSKTKNVEKKSGKKKDEVENYKKMREKLLNNLRALEKLYSDGIVDEETYKRSRTELKRKISCVDEIILTKIKIEEIKSLKEDVLQLLKSRIKGGVFLEEEKQIKEDIKALKLLYEEGLVSESEFKKKLEILQKKLKSDNEIVEDIMLLFKSWERKLEEKISLLKIEVEGKKEQKQVKEEKRSESIIDKLFSLRKEESKKYSDEEIKTPFEKLKEVYTKEKGIYAIGDMILILKKEIEKKLRSEKELTHKELIELLKNSDMNKDLKKELIEFFKEISQKEYTGDIGDEEVHAIYERCRMFLERILISGDEKKKNQNKEKIEKTRNEDKVMVISSEKKEIVNKLKNLEEKKKKKKSLIDKINEFFGV